MVLHAPTRNGRCGRGRGQWVPGTFSSSGDEIPYLIHTGYKLALMVQRRKPYSFIDLDSASVLSDTRKARFDAYVAKGVLRAHEGIFDVGQPGRRIGRTVYAVAGEEWRIPASEFIRQNINA